MKSKYNIHLYSDLEREEIRVKKRIQKSEIEIKEHLKNLPQEIVTTGITKAISGIISGNLFRSVGSIFRSVKSYFLDKREDSSSKGFKSILFEIFENIIRNGFQK